MVTHIQKILGMPNTDTSDNVKKKYQKYIQSHTIAKSILILNINPSILIDDYNTNLVKEI